jgi:cytosine/adenosine deaminase-related metal-dependent hydrolase
MVLKHQSVLIRGNKIEAVGTKVDARDAEIIDGKGKTLVPGLWDMHVHVEDADGLLHIACGVTSARDLANDIDKIAALKKSYESGEAIGPRLVLAGFIDGRGPFAGPTKIFADTPEEARTQVDHYAKLGYEQIKIYSSVKPELVPVITKAAHEHGLRVSGHIPAFMTATQAVKDGYDEIQHANFLMLNFLDVKDTRGPARFTEVADRTATFDLDGKPMRDFITLLKERHITIDPTLNAYEGLFVNRRGVVSPSFAAVAMRLPLSVQRSFLTGGLPIPDGKDQRYRDSFGKLVEMVGKMYRAGVRVVAGTDNVAGFALDRELELYVQAGIPAAEVLRLATFNAAQLMKRDDRLGSIETGKLADVVLVDGDPTKNISDLRKLDVVIKDGVLFRVSELYRALNIR